MTEQNTNQPTPSAPPQGQMYFPPQYYAPEDEIDLRELFGVIWKGKWWIIGITAIFAVASVFYALSLPNEYKATAIVAPVSEQGGGLSKMAGQLGGLASLAGINLASGESSDAAIAMEIMKTWGFQEDFIRKHSLEVPIFAAKNWNQSTNELILDDELYDVSLKKWIREAPKGKTVEPTSWELHDKFREKLIINQSAGTGLITISYTHNSPIYSKNITQWLIEDLNLLMKERSLLEAEKNIDYLEDQINRTPLSEMQKVFYTLIQEQTKNKMLADVSDEYVFKYVSKPRVPEQKSGPKKSLICILGTLLGGIFSVVFLLAINFLGKENS